VAIEVLWAARLRKLKNSTLVLPRSFKPEDDRREGSKMIPVMALILLLGAFYGYLIGGAAKRRSLSGKRIKLVALLPFFPMCSPITKQIRP